MFHLLKFIVWLVGIAVVGFFVLRYFGYEVNMNYFNESKVVCQERLNQCSKELVEQGTKNAKCDFNCLDPKLIIKKQ
ncbi:MAG TPA: hypothetical protein P5323_01315 [Candidatus Moranbacteria bacterium]|nr:hypothetical protein [Candidatus Moranbacteria bacterium]HRY27753.1 hypothetical protein [Candidatus Moranbacteria bacterium]HSA08168.1 hypothetical protein [Candidatus Moranbacteria bacterium]